MSQVPAPVDLFWRQGARVGRTIYAVWPPGGPLAADDLIGVMDTSDLAREAVDAHNAALRARGGGSHR